MDSHDIPDLDARGLRRFALTTGVTVALLFGAALPWIFGLRFRWWPWIVFAVLAVWGLLAPATLRPVYRGWMRFGLLLNKVTTPIIMGAFFFVAVVPIGLAMRAFGRDSLHRSFDKNLESYRMPSEKAPKENFERPF